MNTLWCHHTELGKEHQVLYYTDQVFLCSLHSLCNLWHLVLWPWSTWVKIENIINSNSLTSLQFVWHTKQCTRVHQPNMFWCVFKQDIHSPWYICIYKWPKARCCTGLFIKSFCKMSEIIFHQMRGNKKSRKQSTVYCVSISPDIIHRMLVLCCCIYYQ